MKTLKILEDGKFTSIFFDGQEIEDVTYYKLEKESMIGPTEITIKAYITETVEVEASW